MDHKDRLTRRRFVSGAAASVAGLAAGLPQATTVKAAESDKWGDLVGRLIYDGPAPERKKLKVDKDVQCCGKYDIRDESLMVGKEGGLANVYVYVRSRRVDVCPELEESVEPRMLLENKDCIFVPHCMKIWCTKQEFYIFTAGGPAGKHHPSSCAGFRHRGTLGHLEIPAKPKDPRSDPVQLSPLGKRLHPAQGSSLRGDHRYGRKVLHPEAAGGEAGVPGVAGADRLPGYARLAQGAFRDRDPAGDQRPRNHQAKPVGV